jgi:hypothetical protein
MTNRNFLQLGFQGIWRIFLALCFWIKNVREVVGPPSFLSEQEAHYPVPPLRRRKALAYLGIHSLQFPLIPVPFFFSPLWTEDCIRSQFNDETLRLVIEKGREYKKAIVHFMPSLNCVIMVVSTGRQEEPSAAL